MSNSFWTRQLGALVAFCVISVCHADPPSWGRQQGVLVLRNGRVLRGEITQVGDRIIVAMGDTDEVAVPLASVQLRCVSLEEAYQRQSEQLSPPATAASHLALADWCLANGLLPQAAEQLMAVQRLEPKNAEIARFERRLHWAARTDGAATASPPAKTSTGTVKLEPQVDLDQFTRELPPGTVEQFTSSIQPLLINRCGASACHGPNSACEYRLNRPVVGRLASRRLTQRNLYASLQYVDKEKPLSSQLVLQATQLHGKSRQAPIDPRETDSLRQLVNWLIRFQQGPIQLTNLTPPATVLSQPASITEPTAQLVTHEEPIPPSFRTGNRREDVPVTPTADPTADASARSSTVASAPTSTEGARDPFDPEVFNRRYHR